MIFLKKIVVYLLTWEARLVLMRYKPRVIAVTGSMGKTSTKEAIYAALSGSLHVRKSMKSFNSELGVPLAVLGLENAWSSPLKWGINIIKGFLLVVWWKHNYPAWLVLEVGADRPGDIRSIAKWLRPDIAVITGVPDIPVHVEFFESTEALLKEKRALAEYLKPGGKLILNGDDERMRRVQTDFRGATLTYGLESNNDFRADQYEVHYENERPIGMRFRAERDTFSVPVEVFGSLGLPRVYAGLAAIAAAECVGVDAVSAGAALRGWEPPAGRLRIVPGIKGTTIIDDTYNSSPAAALAALDTLKEIKAPAGKRIKRIAILGDMLELGKYSTQAHRSVGERAAKCASMLVTVGFRSRATAEAALDAGMKDEKIRQYELGESQRAGKELETELKEGDIILIKGSQGMRMEKAVRELMSDPERASELLVRQEEEWLNR